MRMILILYETGYIPIKKEQYIKIYVTYIHNKIQIYVYNISEYKRDTFNYIYIMIK
jgi:hypothetical protein